MLGKSSFETKTKFDAIISSLNGLDVEVSNKSYSSVTSLNSYKSNCGFWSNPDLVDVINDGTRRELNSIIGLYAGKYLPRLFLSNWETCTQ